MNRKNYSTDYVGLSLLLSELNFFKLRHCNQIYFFGLTFAC